MSLNIGDQIPEFELYNHDKTKYSDKYCLRFISRKNY